jgi:hypothetical protein
MNRPLTNYEKFMTWFALLFLCVFSVTLAPWSLWQMYVTYQQDQRFLNLGKNIYGTVVDLRPQNKKGVKGWHRLVECENSSGEKATLFIEFPVVGISEFKWEALKNRKPVELEYVPATNEVREKRQHGLSAPMNWFIGFALSSAIFLLTSFGLVRRKALGL